MLGKIKGKRMRWLDSITDSMDINLSKFWEMVKGREGWRATVQSRSESDITATEQQWEMGEF